MKSDPVFSSYLGIDWSGAKAKHHAGLQIAVAKTRESGAETDATSGRPLLVTLSSS